MAKTVNVAEAKRDFSELMTRAAHKGERFIIARRGKPMAALVSMEDLRKLTPPSEKPRGLLAAVGAWADFEGLEKVIADIYRSRRRAMDRKVPRLD
jgi:prevent-host-death family protein